MQATARESSLGHTSRESIPWDLQNQVPKPSLDSRELLLKWTPFISHSSPLLQPHATSGNSSQRTTSFRPLGLYSEVETPSLHKLGSRVVLKEQLVQMPFSPPPEIFLGLFIQVLQCLDSHFIHILRSPRAGPMIIFPIFPRRCSAN